MAAGAVFAVAAPRALWIISLAALLALCAVGPASPMGLSDGYRWSRRG